MTIRKDLLMIIGVSLVSILAVLYVSSRLILLRSYARLEEQEIGEDLQRALGQLSEDQAKLNITTGDYAAWDDTYAFVAGGQSNYPQANLNDQTYQNLHLNLVLIVNTAGQIVYGSGYDLVERKPTPVPAGLLTHITPSDRLLDHATTDSNLTGVVLLPEGPMIVASQPILTSDATGPIRGTLIMGRYLSTVEIGQLAKIANVSLTFHRFDDPQLPEDFAAARANLSPAAPTFIRRLDADMVAGYSLVIDLYGQPALLVRVDTARDIYTQGQASLNYFMEWFGVVGLVFSATIYIALDRLILSRREQRTTESKYQTLFENAVEGMFQSTPGGRFINVNPAMAHIYGYDSPQEMVEAITNISSQIYVDPDERDEFIRLLQTHRVIDNFEGYNYRKDGALIWTSTSARVVRDAVGNLLYYEGFLQDITERKQAEEALKNNERRFRALIENGLDNISLLAADGTLLWESPAVTRTLGYAPNEFIGHNTFELMHPDDLDLTRNLYAELIQEPGSRQRSAFRLRRSDGTWRWVEAVVTNLLNEPSVKAIVINYRDITERKQAEDEIRRQAARAEALARVAARLNAQLDLETVLNAVCEEIARALNAPATAVRLYQPNQDSLYYAQAYGLPPDYRKYTRPSPRALFDDLIRQQGPLIVALDVQALSPVPNAELYTALNIRTVVTAAMIREGQLIGGLNVFSVGETRLFTEDELALLKSLADQAAQAIVNARLYEENLRKLDALVALYATAQQLTQSRDLRTLARETVRTCVDAFGARLAWLGRAEPDGRVTIFEAFGQATEAPQRLRPRWDEAPEGQSAVGTAIRTGFPVVIADLASDLRTALWREAVLAAGFRCMIALPLISRDRPFGALVLFSDQPDAFSEERVGFLKSYANQVAAALENARLFAETERRLEHVQALRTIDQAITSSLDLNLTLNIVLGQVTSQLNVDAADILLLLSPAQMLEYAAGRGFRTSAIQETRRHLGEGNAGRAALERRVVHIPHLPSAGSAFTRTGLLIKENFIAYYGVPLIAKGQVKGVLEIFHRAPLDPDPEWLAFMEALAGQAAIAIDNTTLFDDLQRSNVELALAYDTTLEGWSRALDLRDKETEGHTQRVTEMTLKLAQAMGFGEDELVQMRRGALLHDIGKMGIPDAILLKPGKLTDDEWEIMRRHPIYAYDLLSPIAYLRPALDIPYCHHEKWNGTGYPRALKGEQIPLAARLFAVVDVWDALRSDRPYRSGWPEDKVREHIRSLADTHFDPQAVEAFLNLEII